MNTKKIHELLGSKSTGFYIDVGAFDGLQAKIQNILKTLASKVLR